MNELEYWSRLSGYWELFKDKDIFTELWGGMLRGCREYADLWAEVNHPGILSCPETITLSWEMIIINTMREVSILNEDGTTRAYQIIDIPTIMSPQTSIIYSSGTDYTISDGKLMWIITNPGEPYYLAEEVVINAQLLERYYNNGLFDFVLANYQDVQRKWILYACMRYLDLPYTISSLANIISIIAGVPFSKYYAHMSYGDSKCNITYAITVDHDYADYLKQHNLANYCMLDEVSGDIYDGEYPADGPKLTLCHKHNLRVNNAGSHEIILRGETVDIPTTLTANTGVTSGELIPVALWGDIVEDAYEPEYYNLAIPLSSVTFIDGQVTGHVPSDDINYIMDGEKMRVSYLDNIEINNCAIAQDGEITVADPALHIFEVGESVVINDVGKKSYVTIISGRYNRVDQVYTLMTYPQLESGEVTLIIPRQASAIIPVGVDPTNKEVTFTLGLSDENEPITLSSCDEGIAAHRSFRTDYNIEEGVFILSVPNDFNILAGDIISITTQGEQDYYIVTSIVTDIMEISPSTKRAYKSGAYIYNNRSFPIINTVKIILEAGSADWIRDNIEKYMTAWDIGHEISIISYDDYITPALSSISIIDKRFWSPIGNGAIKENKE